MQKWRQANPEKARLAGQKSAAKHRKNHPEYMINWTKKNLQYKRRANLLKIHERRQYLLSLRNKPCVDCGGTFHPVAMDFDHVKGDKVLSVSRMVSFNKQRLDAEIAKCDVICSNCHRIRTYKRMKEGI